MFKVLVLVSYGVGDLLELEQGRRLGALERLDGALEREDGARKVLLANICIRAYVYMCICICICMCTYVYTYIHIYTE